MFPKHVKFTLVVGAMLAASCGSGDDTSGTADVADQEPTTVALTSPPTDDGASSSPNDTVDDEPGASGFGGDDQLVIAGPGDVSPECVDALVTFLQAIEPSAEEIDWSLSGEVDDGIEMFFVSLADASEEFSVNASVCESVDVNLIEGAEIELLLQIARDEAPGVVPWLEFLRELSASQK